MPLRTPLYDRHVAAGASMVEFAGYEMPLQYSGIRDEHLAVRRRAGLFDLSHMGEVAVSGDGATGAVQRLLTNEMATLQPGRARYSMMCTEGGGIVDDVVAYRDQALWMIVVNAATRAGDIAWMSEHLAGEAILDDESDATALVAVQGPRAAAIVQRVTATPLDTLRTFGHSPGVVAGVAARISRTGYTGEDGFELFVDAAAAPALWDALRDAGEPDGLLPAGLGARDTLRLEAGLRLYGQDMDRAVDPFSCGLAWTVKLGKGDFIGRDALEATLARGAPRRFIGLLLEDRAIARHGHEVLDGGRKVGIVTSGTHSFTLGRGIATASVEPAAAEAARLTVDIRGRPAGAEVVTLPFYRRQP